MTSRRIVPSEKTILDQDDRHNRPCRASVSQSGPSANLLALIYLIEHPSAAPCESISHTLQSNHLQTSSVHSGDVRWTDWGIFLDAKFHLQRYDDGWVFFFAQELVAE